MVRPWLAASAALLCSTTAFAVGTVDPVGKWETGRGPLTIEKAADGSFTFVFEKLPGKMTGEIYSYGDGDLRMKGAWWDIEQVKECGQESDGSKHWGGFDVTFHGPPNLDREVFGGVWTFCELIDFRSRSRRSSGVNFFFLAPFFPLPLFFLAI